MTKSTSEENNVAEQSTEGPVVTIRENEELTLGTSFQFKKGSVCHWQLVVGTAYASMKKVSIKVDGKAKAKLYSGASLTDILENGGEGKTLEDG